MPARFASMHIEVERMTGARPQQFLVQEMIGGGVEMILGVNHDSLGTAILLGMGGVTTELMKDVVLRMLPEGGGLSRDEALAMARSLKGWPLLDGWRGRPKADVEALVSAICGFSKMAGQLGPRLAEAEINPLFVLPQGSGAKAADGVAVLLESAKP
jgi:hypothetical protein